MTDDQQFILALATLIVPTVATVLTYRKTDQTHKAVNGIQTRALRRARTSGRTEGMKEGLAAKPVPPEAMPGTMGNAGNPPTP